MNYKISKTKKVYQPMRRGFSLMELLIVLAIISIMAGVLFASRNSGKAASDVESAARQIATIIRSAQNDALTGKMVMHEGVFTKITSFGVQGVRLENDIASGTMSVIQFYEVTPAYGGDIFAQDIKRVSFSEEVGGSCYPYDIPALIAFSPPFGSISTCGMGTDSGKGKILLISKTDIDMKYTICINIGGSVREIKDDVVCN